jgi:hypothetical protein
MFYLDEGEVEIKVGWMISDVNRIVNDSTLIADNQSK